MSGSRRRGWRAGAIGFVMVVSAAVVAGTGFPAWATTLTISGQTMEGDLQLPPGSTVGAGYDITIPSGATVTVSDATVALHYACAQNGPAKGVLVLSFPNATLSGSGWQPSGDQQSAAVWQVPNQSVSAATAACGGGSVWVNSHTGGATFSGDFGSAPPGAGLSVRFHYRETNPRSTSGSWSATEHVTTSAVSPQTQSQPAPSPVPSQSPAAQPAAQAPAPAPTCAAGTSAASSGQCVPNASTPAGSPAPAPCSAGNMPATSSGSGCGHPAVAASSSQAPVVSGLSVSRPSAAAPSNVAAAPSGGARASGSLPFTGLDVAGLALLGLAALLGGWRLVRAVKRPHAQPVA